MLQMTMSVISLTVLRRLSRVNLITESKQLCYLLYSALYLYNDIYPQ